MGREKQQNNNLIPYYICQNPKEPHRLFLIYQSGSKVRQEVVNVTPNGYQFGYHINRNNFSNLDDLFTWFKINYRQLTTREPVHHGQQHHGGHGSSSTRPQPGNYIPSSYARR